MKKILSAASLAILIGGSALTITACEPRETPEETRQDVADAASEGRQEVAEEAADASRTAAEGRQDVARADDAAEAREAAADATENNADARDNLAMQKAKADYEVAKERCEGLPTDQQANCKKIAESTYEAAKASAERAKDAMQDKADVQRN